MWEERVGHRDAEMTAWALRVPPRGGQEWQHLTCCMDMPPRLHPFQGIDTKCTVLPLACAQRGTALLQTLGTCGGCRVCSGVRALSLHCPTWALCVTGSVCARNTTGSALFGESRPRAYVCAILTPAPGCRPDGPRAHHGRRSHHRRRRQPSTGRDNTNPHSALQVITDILYATRPRA